MGGFIGSLLAIWAIFAAFAVAVLFHAVVIPILSVAGIVYAAVKIRQHRKRKQQQQAAPCYQNGGIAAKGVAEDETEILLSFTPKTESRQTFR